LEIEWGIRMGREAEVVSGFRDLFNKLSWLNKIEMEEQLKDYKSSEVHYIEYIGSHLETNVTKLAEAFYMTRGAMSKMTKKLMERGVIESYQNPENRKEIYFRLTAKGREVFEVHEHLHQKFQERDRAVFNTVTDAQFENVLNFLEKYSKHLDHEIKKLESKVK